MKDSRKLRGEKTVASKQVINALKKVIADTEDNIETIVKNMMGSKRFTEAIDDMIEAAKAGIVFSRTNNNESMLKFNTLCLDFFQKILNKDENGAIDAAKALVKNGHGKAFGLA